MTDAQPDVVDRTGTTIEFTFPLGRYHATAMGTSANEGIVEWPPSPWRLLRALFSVWRTRCPDLDADDVEQVLNALATTPEYHVDERTSVGHTRHYMPGDSSGRETSNLVHDTFVVCAAERPTLFMTWPTIDLAESARTVLQSLCSRLTWLGRAESLVDARLLDADESAPPTNSFAAPAGWTHPDGSPIQLLVPTQPLDIDALTVDLQQMRSNAKTRSTLPPKAALRTFVRPSPDPVRRPSYRTSPRPRPTAVRLAVVPIEATDEQGSERSSRRGSTIRAVERSRAPARLPVADVLVHASALRRAVMGRYGKLNDGAASPTLSGRDFAGSPRRGHTHAHYLPLPRPGSSDPGRFIESFLVWAPEGFDEPSLEALQRLRSVAPWQWVSASRSFRVVADGIGAAADLAPGLVAAQGSGTTWSSITPVVPGHHPHDGRSWEAQVRTEIRRDLVERGLPDADIALVPWPGRFCTVRPRAGRPSHRAHNARFAATLTFDEPVVGSGPVCLGAQSHFGLGLFRPT